MRLFSRWLRAPLVHFVLIGGVLFAAQPLWSGQEVSGLPSAKKTLLISEKEIDQFARDISLQTGSSPTDEQLQRFVEMVVDDEVLYREAVSLRLDRHNPSIRRRLIELASIADESSAASDEELYRRAIALGLDRYDPVIRRMQIETMRLIVRKVPTQTAPANIDAQELEAYYQEHLAAFKKPERITFTHRYFSRDKRGLKAEVDAREALVRLRSSGAGPDAASEHGDAFLGGKDFAWTSRAELVKIFGPAFPEAIKDTVPGSWVGPIASSYGWHLIFVKDLRPARPFSLSEVANQIRSAIMEQREQRRLVETLERLKAGYQIRVEYKSSKDARS